MPIRTQKAIQPEYRVTRCVDGPGYVRIALVRRASARNHGPGPARQQEIVLAQRTFNTRVELFAQESYAAALERAAEHGNRGTLGCFVQVEPIRGGTVRITLYERWFRGKYLLCELLASRQFDAQREDARAASVAYLLDLREQAAQRNHQREAAAAISAEETTAAERSSDPMPAAEQLVQLLTDL